MDQVLLSGLVATLLMEGSTYGLYVPLFCASLHALCHSMKDVSNRWSLLSVAIALFLTITSHWILQACTVFVSATADPHFVRLLHIPSTIDAIQNALYVTATVLADSMFTYRLFLVWGRKWSVIILPAISMLSASTTLIVLSISPQPPDLHLPPAFSHNLPLFATYLTTFVTNSYITGMMSFKIWRNNRTMASLGYCQTTRIIPMLIESAGIYTLSIAGTIITDFIASPIHSLSAVYSTSAQPMLIPMVGITYSLLIVLVARGRDDDTVTETATSCDVFHDHGAVSKSDIPDVKAAARSDFGL